MALCGLQRSTDEAEEAIIDGFETLDRSLTKTIIGGTLTMPPDVNKYMTQMSIATKQVSALQGVVTQVINFTQFIIFLIIKFSVIAFMFIQSGFSN